MTAAGFRTLIRRNSAPINLIRGTKDISIIITAIKYRIDTSSLVFRLSGIYRISLPRYDTATKFYSNFTGEFL